MSRPEYCPDLDADDLVFPIGPHRPCPACGATVSGTALFRSGNVPALLAKQRKDR